MIEKHVSQWIYSATIGNWNVNSFDLSQSEAEQKASLLKEKGVDTVIIFWLGKEKEYRHILFDSAIFEDKYGFEAVTRILKIIVDACHKNGIRVIEHHGIAFVHYNPENPLYTKTIDQLFYKNKPMIDWCQIDASSGKFNMGFYHGYMFCPNNPFYREAIFNEYIPEILNCGVDGMMLDDVQILPDWYSCCCKFCREKFHKETGYYLPENSEDLSFWGNFKNSAFKAWLKFRIKSTGDFHEDAYKAASRIKKDILSFTCCSNESNVWGAQCCASSASEWVRGANATFQEIVSKTIPFYNIPYVTAHAKLYEAIGRPWNLPNISIFYPKNEAEEFLYWSVSKTWGSLYWSAPSVKYSRDQKYVKWEKEHADIFGKNEVNADIAVLFSKQTRDVYGGCEDDFYSSEWMGVCQILLRNNIQFEVILDSELIIEELSKYKIVLLPNSAHLSALQVKAIKSYVKNGGKIIATFETSLYDENGNRLDEFALSEVLGISYRKTVSEVNLPVMIREDAYKNISAREINNNCPLTFVKPSQNTNTYADIKTEDTTYKYPFIVSSNYGKGRGIYYAGKPGVMSCLHEIRNNNPIKICDNRISEYEKLIISAIETDLSYIPKVEFENLPDNIMVTTVNRNGKLFVHFINTGGCLISQEKLDDVFEYGEKLNEKILLKLTGEITKAKIYSPQIKNEINLIVKNCNKHAIVEIPENTLERYIVLMLELKPKKLHDRTAAI